MDDTMLQRFIENFATAKTEDLLLLWKENDRQGIGVERLEAVKRILTERGRELPAQNEFIQRETVCTFEDSEYYGAFIGSNSEYYLPIFKYFLAKNKREIQSTWNWAAFFLGPVWVSYRKLYRQLPLSLLFVIPFFGLIPAAILGGTGNRLLFTKASQSIEKVRQTAPSGSDLARLITDKGGRNWLLAIVVLAFLVYISLVALKAIG